MVLAHSFPAVTSKLSDLEDLCSFCLVVLCLVSANKQNSKGVRAQSLEIQNVEVSAETLAFNCSAVITLRVMVNSHCLIGIARDVGPQPSQIGFVHARQQ